MQPVVDEVRGWRGVWALLLLALCLGPVSPRAARAKEAAPLQVVTSVPTLAALAKEVGGERVAVRSMATATQDPHFVDARPSHLVALSRADLLLAVGIELEVGWLPNLQVASRNARVQVGHPGFLEVATLVDLLEVPQMRMDRAMGDLHTGGNPHFLNEPNRLAMAACGLAERLAQLDVAHAGQYRARAQALAGRLQAVRQTLRARALALRPEQRRVVAYHKSLAYLMEWLGLEEAAVLEPRPGVPPDPGHVKEVLGTMRVLRVAAILQEEYYPTRMSRTLADLAKVPLVILPGNVRLAAGTDAPEAVEDYVARLGNAVVAALEAQAAAAPAAPKAAP